MPNNNMYTQENISILQLSVYMVKSRRVQYFSSITLVNQLETWSVYV